MSDGLNTVPVLYMHLEEFERVLAHCEGLLVAQDLESGYKSMANTSRPSRLTQAVQNGLDRVRGYMVTEDEDVSEE